MPHLTVEYSANVEGRVDMPALLRVIHKAALDTGVFPLGGTRTRAERRDLYVIADDRPEYMFVHVTARMAQGRTEEVRARVGEALMGAVTGFLAPLQATAPLAISMEIQEMETLNFKQNNIHDLLKQRAAE